MFLLVDQHWYVHVKKVTYEIVLTLPACLARLTWMIYEIGGKWPYSCFFGLNRRHQGIFLVLPFLMRRVSILYTFEYKIRHNIVLLYSHLHHHSASQRHNIKDRRMNKRRMIKTQEGRHRKTSLTIFYLSLYCKGSKGLLKVCMWEGAEDRTYDI